jgi:hypothetical protein
MEKKLKLIIISLLLTIIIIIITNIYSNTIIINKPNNDYTLKHIRYKNYDIVFIINNPNNTINNNLSIDIEKTINGYRYSFVLGYSEYYKQFYVDIYIWSSDKHGWLNWEYVEIA